MARTIQGFPNYTVSIAGRVYSELSQKFLKPVKFNTGYHKYTLCNNGKRTQVLAHRLVATAYLSNPEGKPCVNHIDGDKSNNIVSNLEWCTYSENAIHACKIGLWNPKGAPIGYKQSKKTISKRRESTLKSNNPYNTKEYTLNLKGKKVNFKNMDQYCKDNNLTVSCMFRVLKGERKSHKGYTI